MSQQNPEVKDYPITFGAVYPEKMSRLTTFFRIFLLIPHGIVLYFLSIAAGVVAFHRMVGNNLHRFHILRGMYDFYVGYIRWSTRVSGYGSLLTDKFPPFTMDLTSQTVSNLVK